MANDSRLAIVIAGSPFGQMEGSPANALKPILPQGLFDRCTVVEWSRQPSSHYTLRLATDLVELLRSLVRDGYGGLVVACGTDVLEEMAYLADLLWSYPQPVIFTGASNSMGKLSNDGIVNLVLSTIAVTSEALWGLGVLVHARGELFAASEVLKVYSHRGSDFQAPGRGPIGEVILDQVQIYRTPRRPVALSETVTPAKRVELLWASLGGGDGIISSLSKDEDLEGLVMAGFGTGNVPPSWVPFIKVLIRREIPVMITSRCIQGQVMPVYSFEASAKKLFELGVLNGGSLRPVQARLKLAVGLGAGLQGENLQRYLLGAPLS